MTDEKEEPRRVPQVVQLGSEQRVSEPAIPESQSLAGKLAHKQYVFRSHCPFHPITFLDECLECESSCIPIGNIVGDEMEATIPKSVRDEILIHMNGPENPLIKLRELTGITLRYQLIRDDPQHAPKFIQYLQHLDAGHYKRHWRLFYQGYHAWRAVGELSAGGLITQTLPPDIQILIDYYRAHIAVMGGNAKPQDVLESEKFAGMEDNDTTYTFNTYIDALKVVGTQLVNLVKLLKKETEDGGGCNNEQRDTIEALRKTLQEELTLDNDKRSPRSV